MSKNQINLSELGKIFEDAVENVEEVVEEGINTDAEDLLSVSQKLAPLDEGGLMENGSVDPAKKEGNEIVASVGYSKEYALKMHEDIYNLGDTSAKKSDFEGMKVGRKYLEQPSKKYGQKYADHLANKMKDVFE